MELGAKIQDHLKAIKPLFYIFFLVLASTFNSQAQTASVTATQPLGFGAFILGTTGGTVTISNTGDRSSTGDVVLASLGVSYFPAQLEITAPAGKIISILNGPDVQLTGSNGGSVTLSIGTSDKGAIFTAAASPTVVTIGGTLTVGNQQNNPAGNYSGTFSVTFIEQ